MSTTNHTTHYELSQYIGTDVTSYLSNYNSDMYKIDAQMKVNADDAAEAKSDAATAVATSTTAASNASAAVSTANAANSTAEAAQTAATAAQTAAGAAQTTAESALAASASNTIGNLAPAYDPTLTYAVGDLITYVDPETNQGKLYKCIVAIDTPEAFNINKWDDVTTSEVYSRKEVILSSVSCDGVITYQDVLTRLGQGVTFTPTTQFRGGNGQGMYFIVVPITGAYDDYGRFETSGAPATNIADVTSIEVPNSNTHNPLYRRCRINDSNGTAVISTTNLLDSAPSNGAIFELVDIR